PGSPEIVTSTRLTPRSAPARAAFPPRPWPRAPRRWSGRPPPSRPSCSARAGSPAAGTRPAFRPARGHAGPSSGRRGDSPGAPAPRSRRSAPRATPPPAPAIPDRPPRSPPVAPRDPPRVAARRVVAPAGDGGCPRRARRPTPHVVLHVAPFPRPLAEEGAQRHAQRSPQSGELLARVRRSLDHLEQLGEPEDVGQLDRSRQAQPAGERARRADVCDGEFLA